MGFNREIIDVVEITPAAKEGLKTLTKSKRIQAMDKISEIKTNPFVGDHKTRELWCKRGIRLSHIRIVYQLRKWERRAIVLAVAPHDEAYLTADI